MAHPLKNRVKISKTGTFDFGARKIFFAYGTLKGGSLAALASGSRPGVC